MRYVIYVTFVLLSFTLSPLILAEEVDHIYTFYNNQQPQKVKSPKTKKSQSHSFLVKHQTPSHSPSDKALEGSIAFTNGYRNDHFKWNMVTEDILDSDVFSELTFKGMDIYEIEGSAEIVLFQLLTARGSINYGEFSNAALRDSDYIGPGKNLEFSRFKADVDGDVFDASIGGGIQIPIFSDLFITPLAGWSYHEQNFKMTNFVFNLPNFSEIPYEGMKSNFNTEWQGPWVGGAVKYYLDEKTLVHFTFEYHWPDYTAKGKWNFPEDFLPDPTYTQKADGQGIVFEGGIDYFITSNLTFSIKGRYQDWSTDTGKNHTVIQGDTIEDSRLTDVEWRSWSLLAGLKYQF